MVAPKMGKIDKIIPPTLNAFLDFILLLLLVEVQEGCLLGLYILPQSRPKAQINPSAIALRHSKLGLSGFDP